MADRTIYKFRFSEMVAVAEAFADLINSVPTSEKDIDNVINKSFSGNIKGFAKFASVIIPCGLRLTEEEKEKIPPEALMSYVPKIIEVNKGFFSVLLQELMKTIENLPMLLQWEIPTSPIPKKESAQKN